MEFVQIALSKSQWNCWNKNKNCFARTATSGCKDPITPTLRTALLEKAKIDVNETTYYLAINNYGPDNVGVFPTINFTSNEFLGEDNLKLTATETGNNLLKHKEPDYNIDVRFSQYLDDKVLASREFMTNFIGQNFGKNLLKFSPPVIINNDNIDDPKWKAMYQIKPDNLWLVLKQTAQNLTIAFIQVFQQV